MTMQIPRFAFEKFPGSKAELSTQMKSVGEAMAMGRTFQESMQKALRSLETGLDGWSLPKNWKRMTDQQLIYGLRVPNPDRMMVMKQVCVCVCVVLSEWSEQYDEASEQSESGWDPACVGRKAGVCAAFQLREMHTMLLCQWA